MHRLTHAFVAAWKVDQPPSKPSTNGATSRNLCPWPLNMECGIETSTKTISLRSARVRGRDRRAGARSDYAHKHESERRCKDDRSASPAVAELAPEPSGEGGEDAHDERDGCSRIGATSRGFTLTEARRTSGTISNS